MKENNRALYHQDFLEEDMTVTKVTHTKGSNLRTTQIYCLCGRPVHLTIVGNNNANGKRKCECGRNITVHFRRHKERK